MLGKLRDGVGYRVSCSGSVVWEKGGQRALMKSATEGEGVVYWLDLDSAVHSEGSRKRVSELPTRKGKYR